MHERIAVQAAVIGGGPAGLMAAEILLGRGVAVHLYDGMPAVARKLVVAGQSNLSLTRAQPFAELLACYGDRAEALRPFLQDFTPEELRNWVGGLGVETFVGSTGQVFPTEMTADTLLSRWLERLRESGLTLHVRHRWQGWDEDGALIFHAETRQLHVTARATVLALGGGSWPQLGSTGEWLSILRARGVGVQPLQPANCGFDAEFSNHFRERCHGQPVKNVVLTLAGEEGAGFHRRGEFVVTSTGVEGGLFYACGSLLRPLLAEKGKVVVHLDLCPDRTLADLTARLASPRGKRSLSSHLRRAVGIDGVKAGLLREFADREDFAVPEQLARRMKELPLPLLRPRPLAEAISTAGGVSFSNLDERLMLRGLPGVFCAGEMLDWEAPTGGYLLTACFATGRAAGLGAAAWLEGGGEKERGPAV